MSKAVLICPRKQNQKENFFLDEDLKALSERLVPDNIQAQPPCLIHKEGVFLGLINPHSDLIRHEASVCMGSMIKPASDWWRPLSEAPDGSYALFRSDSRSIEIVSDALATRTIWYIMQEEVFAASTSQRALAYFLRDYQPCRETWAWMLSTGTQGPGLSWDQRIKCLPGDARLALDRMEWALHLETKPPEFIPEPGSDAHHRKLLRKALDETMGAIDLDVSRWVLPLSGGYDSRALLLLNRKLSGMKAVTWGTRDALQDRESDAWVGLRVARHFGLEHQYFEIDLSREPVERIVRRFLVAGEGRIDHITAYMDGFRLWKNLNESGCRGIVRGDEAFGCKPVKVPDLIYQRFGLFVLDDFSNLRPIASALAELGQSRPGRLERRPGESLTTWADRMGAEVEIPVNFAALNDLKLSYVEIINPLLARRIIEAVRRLPDHLRAGKKLFRSIVEELNPGLPFAKYRAIPWFGEAMRSEAFLNLMRGEIDTPRARRMFSDQVVDFMLAGLPSSAVSERGSRARRRPPVRLDDLFMRKILGRAKVDKRMNPVVFAFRAYIVLKMQEILTEDAFAHAKVRSSRLSGAVHDGFSDIN